MDSLATLGPRSDGPAASPTRCAGLNVRPPERRLHLAPHLHGEIVFVIADVAPAQALALRDVAFELDLMRKPERQQSLRERARGRNLLAPDAKPAFAVEHLAGLERAFGGGGNVRARARWRCTPRSSRCPTWCRRRNC